jgi:hypothetical protein
MHNGMQLDLPALTTDERASVVKREYRDLLEARAGEQRAYYWLERTALWLAVMLLAGCAAILLRRGTRNVRIADTQPCAVPAFSAARAL